MSEAEPTARGRNGIKNDYFAIATQLIARSFGGTLKLLLPDANIPARIVNPDADIPDILSDSTVFGSVPCGNATMSGTLDSALAKTTSTCPVPPGIVIVPDTKSLFGHVALVQVRMYKLPVADINLRRLSVSRYRAPPL